MIPPHRKNRMRCTKQDETPVASRYARLWKEERFFAWLQWQRRVISRWVARLPLCSIQTWLPLFGNYGNPTGIVVINPTNRSTSQ